MKLGVFNRLVVVLSCFWMVGGTLFVAGEQRQPANQYANQILQICREVAETVPLDEAYEEKFFGSGTLPVTWTDNSEGEWIALKKRTPAECKAARDAALNERLNSLPGGLWLSSFAIALAVLMVALVLVFSIRWSVGWILAGRRSE